MKPKTIEIAGRKIGPDYPPFVIAEMSGNHNRSLDRAMQLVEAAAASGAHALKLQTYTAAMMTLDINEGEFAITDEQSLWKGQSLYSLYEQAHTPLEWHGSLLNRCRELNLLAFSSPFSPAAVDFLEQFEVPAYKIASFENTDLALIRRVAATKKPVIISTGMASVADLDEAVRTCRENGCDDIILLKCTSSYPATPENSNVRTIPHLQHLFGTQVGLSDHTMGVGAAVAAVAHGATVVEKHFTLRRADGGVDSAFSLEPHEMKSLVIETERAWQSLGMVTYGQTAVEKRSLQFRRSLYIAEDVKAGETLTEKNLRAIRPGHGLSPKFYDRLLGKRVNTDVKRGTPMRWELVG